MPDVNKIIARLEAEKKQIEDTLKVLKSNKSVVKAKPAVKKPMPKSTITKKPATGKKDAKPKPSTRTTKN